MRIATLRSSWSVDAISEAAGGQRLLLTITSDGVLPHTHLAAREQANRPVSPDEKCRTRSAEGEAPACLGRLQWTTQVAACASVNARTSSSGVQIRGISSVSHSSDSRVHMNSGPGVQRTCSKLVTLAGTS